MLISNITITAAGDSNLGTVDAADTFISFQGTFAGATVSLFSSKDGGDFQKVRDFLSEESLRYDSAVGETLKLTTTGASENTNIQVFIR